MQNHRIKLKEHNLKVTPQRVYMIEEIEKKGHIGIDDLYKSLKDIFPCISLATVYKNINSMTENGFLTEVKIPNHKAKYEVSKDDHAHLICKKCGELVDIYIDKEWITNNASQQSGYKIENTLVTFEGICPKCQKEEEKA